MSTTTTREVVVEGFILPFVAEVGYAMVLFQRPMAGEPGSGETGEVGGCLSTWCESCDW